MLIAFSSQGDSLDSSMDLRLGRAARFLLVDSDLGTFRVIENPVDQTAHGAGIQTAQMLVKNGAKAVVSGDCGPKAFQVFQASRVPVYSVGGGNVREAFQLFKENKLPEIGVPGKPHQS